MRRCFILHRFRKIIKNQKGFSLIELIVVIVIMVILIAALVPNVVKYVRKSQETSAKVAAKTIYDASQTYVTGELAKGNAFTPNANLDVTVLWSDGVDLMKPMNNYQDVEIKLNDTGDLVKYVYYKNGISIEADYPEGFSGRITE